MDTPPPASASSKKPKSTPLTKITSTPSKDANPVQARPSDETDKTKTPKSDKSTTKAKTKERKEPPKLKQTNLMGMFQAAGKVNNKAATRDPKANVTSGAAKDPPQPTPPDNDSKLPPLLQDTADAKSDNEDNDPLPPLTDMIFYSDIESEDEDTESTPGVARRTGYTSESDSDDEISIPMKPPNNAKQDAPDPNDDWDRYEQMDTSTEQDSNKRKTRGSTKSKKRNKTKPVQEEQEGWSDLEVTDSELNLSGDVVMEDACEETDSATRDEKFRKGLSKAERKFVKQKRKEGNEQSVQELMAERARQMEAEALRKQTEALKNAEDLQNCKPAAKDNDAHSVATEVTADSTAASMSTEGTYDRMTQNQDQGPGTPRRRGGGGRGGGRGGRSDGRVLGRVGDGAGRGGRGPVPPVNPYAPPQNVNETLMNRANAREHSEFMQFVTDVPASPQAAITLWKAVFNAFTELQRAVPSAILQSATQRGNDSRGAITTPSQLPKQLSLLQDICTGIRVQPSGGKAYARIHVAYNGDKEAFWQDARASLKRVKSDIYKSKLPEEPFVTENIMIKNSYPAMHDEEWQTWFQAEMEKQLAREGGRQRPVIFAFNDKPIMDGKKRDRNNRREMRNKRAFYVEVPRGDETFIARLMDPVLKGEEIKNRCRIPLRQVKKYTRFGPLNTQKRISKALIQHSQLRASVTDVACETIDDVDTELGAFDGKTLREMIMDFKNPGNLLEHAILAVDPMSSWRSGSGIVLSVATKYEEDCAPVAEHICAYLYREYGNDILQYFSTNAQADALETAWDPETNRPISWDEQQAKEASADTTVPTWVNQSPGDVCLDSGNRCQSTPSRRICGRHRRTIARHLWPRSTTGHKYVLCRSPT